MNSRFHIIITRMALLLSLVFLGLSPNLAAQSMRPEDIRDALTLIVIKADKDGVLDVHRVARGSSKKCVKILGRMRDQGFRTAPGKVMLYVERDPKQFNEKNPLLVRLLEIYDNRYVSIDGKRYDWEKVAALIPESENPSQ